MPHDTIHPDDFRIHDVLDVLHHLWPEPLSTREEADVRRTLAAGLPRTGDPDLSTYEGRRTMTQTVWSANDVRDGASFRASPVVAAAVKLALGIDDALAGREAFDASPASQGTMRDLLSRCTVSPRRMRPRRTPPAAEPVGSDHHVTFAFPWRPTPIGTRQRLGTATAYAGVTAVDPADATVACSLWTPDGYLDVRRHGTTWLRPLLSPDSWSPISLDLFAEAAATGVAWRDSPFLTHTGRGSPTFDLSDYASPRAPAKGDDRRIAQARDACLTRVGWLCVIDGIVHRTTSEPLAGVAVLSIDDGFEVGPVWSLGDIDSTCLMDTMDCFEGVVARCASGRVRPDPCARSTCRRVLVPVADWVGTVADTPARSPEPEGVATGRWPRAHGLVLLADGALEPSDAGDAFRAAAASSADALTPAQVRDALRGYGCEFGDLHVLLRTLCEVGLAPDFRRAALSYVEPSCRLVVDALPYAPEPTRGIWAYVVALARYGAGCEIRQAVEVDDLTTLRL